MPKIMYVLCGKFNKYEAISKDILFLKGNFDSRLLYLVKDSKNKVLSKLYEFYNNLKLLVYLTFLKNKYDIMHVFCNLNDKIHINILSLLKGRKKIILNSFSSIDEFETKYISKLRKFDKIIVECNIDNTRLLKQGIENVDVIYPSIKIVKSKDKNNKKLRKIKVLFASSPFDKKHFETRGINLLINTIKRYDTSGIANFIFLWRLKYKKELLRKIKDIKNIEVIDGLLDDISVVYKKTSALIVPFVTEKDNKRCPRSVIESLSFGKPVLVSKKVGIADIIEKENCGIVFADNEKDLYEAIIKLKNKYKNYEKNTIKTLKKYFDGDKNLKKISGIYNNLANVN